MSELRSRLIRTIEPFCADGIVLAFSGGVDSSLLLQVLSLLQKSSKFPAAAVMMYSLFQTRKELQEAEEIAESSGIFFYQIGYAPLSIPEIRNNSRDRCYFCKKNFFMEIRKFAEKNGMKYIFDGTNSDDFKSFRPGQKALKELGIRSPLAEAGFTKENVRELSRELGLTTAEKAASPCLATRFPYDTVLTEEKIRCVESGESLLRQLFPSAKQLRLRLENDTARIEISPENLSEICCRKPEVERQLTGLGFRNIEIDFRGYRSGSYDQKTSDI